MQTRLNSFIEASLNTASGFIISYLMGMLVYPLFGFSVTMAQNFWIVVIFTVVSVIRSYVWRRLFNAAVPKTEGPGEGSPFGEMGLHGNESAARRVA